MAEGFTDLAICQGGKCDVVEKTVEGDGSVVLLDNRDTASSKVQSITIKDSTISNTPFKLSGSQNISVSDTVFTGPESGKAVASGFMLTTDTELMWRTRLRLRLNLIM